MQNDIDLESLVAQVNKNCDISDARYAGVYSVCGLALRLRDLYKWRMGLDPWTEGDSVEVLQWIGDKEQEWACLEEEELHTIEIGGGYFDPMDTASINAFLEPHGLLYGAGYARSVKPTFFLGVIADQKTMEGLRVYTLGRELARDLFTAPALSQEDCIVIRKETAKAFLWDKMQYINTSGRPALKSALAYYAVCETQSDALRHHLERIAVEETEAYMHHEIGEIRDTVFDRGVWREIVASFPGTRIELVSRAVKDLLADTNEYGMLRYISANRKAASLAFYVAFIESLTKKLFPHIIPAFEEYTRTQDWGAVEDAIRAGHDIARAYAETIVDIYQSRREEGRESMEEELSRRMLNPLGM